MEAEEAERARVEAEEAAELERMEAEEAERERVAAEEAAELERMEAEEAERLAAEEGAKREAQDALRRASEERAKQAEEKKARLEAEEMARIEAEEAARAEADEAARIEAQETARFEAREAAEFARLEAEDAKELARMEAEEAERLAAEEGAGDEEFTLEELAAFDTNLTEGGDLVAEPQEAPPVESFFEDSSAAGRPRVRLMPEDQVIDAPSIGKKTARRLNRVGIFTVEDLLNCDSEEIAFELDVRHVDEPTLEEWKSQARLMIEVPGLRVHDAQILVGAGVRNAEDLASASATSIFHASMGFLKSSEGARVVRDDHVLLETEVDEWIGLAKERDAA